MAGGRGWGSSTCHSTCTVLTRPSTRLDEKMLWFVLSVGYSVGLKFISRSFHIYFIATCQFHVHGASIHTRNNIATTESIRELVKVAGEVGTTVRLKTLY